MELYEVPKSPLYNGEEIIPERFRGDNISAQQWIFEKHYANSTFSCGIPFFDRFFRGPGFAQYQFYHGGNTPPEWVEDGALIWWQREKNHWETYGTHNESSPYILFLREWIFARAASESGFNMFSNPTNRWLDEYLEFAPMSATDL